MLKAKFAEVDITPPLGILKMGWKKKIIADEVLLLQQKSFDT